MNKLWVVPVGGHQVITHTRELLASLLRQRGITTESDAHSFLTPQFERDIHDPHALYDIDNAVDSIRNTIKQGKRIMVYGDYDVDGITSTAIMVKTIELLGGLVQPFIPHRLEHGYGVNETVLHHLVDEFDLFITVDCGINSRKEIAWLREQKKEVIVIDHHEIEEGKELPPANAILHPRHPMGTYPFGYLCGAGVAYKLSQALIPDNAVFHEEVLSLAALGTIADMVPLVGENRAIVYFGLPVLSEPHTMGLRTLLDHLSLTGKTLSPETISWRVVPFLNAAGKMDHAGPALELLLATTEEKALAAIKKIAGYNTLRQTMTKAVAAEAITHVTADDAVCIAVNAEWPAGVVGIVASRLVDAFKKPAIVIGGNGKHAVGSARSMDGVNILELLSEGKQHALKMGGHARAAGFSLDHDNIEHFTQAIRAKALDYVAHLQNLPETKHADAIIDASIISSDMLSTMEHFAPFGEGNKRPLFIARGLQIGAWRPVGKDQSHAKYLFSVNGTKSLDGIGFGLAEQTKKAGRNVDILFSVGENEYRGRRTLQAQVYDIEQEGMIDIKEKAYA